MKKKLSVAVVSSSLLLNMLSSAAFAEPAGMYYAGKYYSADYIQTKMDAGDKTFASVVKKAQAAKSDAYVVLDDRNSYVTAKDYDFENGEATGDVSLLNESTPLKASYTNANSKESLKKVTPDSLKAAQISADGKTITFDLADSKYIKMSSTTSAYTLVDEKGAKGPVVSKVKADAKKKTLTLTLKTAVTAGTLYTVMYNKTDTGLDIKQPVKDTVAPVITTSLKDGLVVKDAKLEFTASAKDNVDGAVVPTVSDDGVVLTGKDGKYSVTLEEGKHTFTIEAKDAAGNVAKSTYTVTYAPEKTVGVQLSSSTLDLKAGGDVSSVTVTTDPSDATITLTNSNPDAASVVADGKTLKVTPKAKGSTKLVVTANKDGYVSGTAELTINVAEADQAVTVTAITATNELGKINITTTAEKTQPSAEALKAAISISPATSFEVTGSNGSYLLTMTGAQNGTEYTLTFGAGFVVNVSNKVKWEQGVTNVVASVSDATTAGFKLTLNPAVSGLTDNQVVVTDATGATVATTVSTNDNGAIYNVKGTFTAGSTYTTTITKPGYNFGEPLHVQIPAQATLTVKSVEAITTTGVTVSFDPLSAAMTNVTVEVKNPAGETIAVTPLNLAVGANQATFNFVTPLTTVAEGTWKVNGVDKVVKHNPLTFTAEAGVNNYEASVTFNADVKVSAAAEVTATQGSSIWKGTATPDATNSKKVAIVLKTMSSSGNTAPANGTPVTLSLTGVTDLAGNALPSSTTATYTPNDVTQPTLVNAVAVDNTHLEVSFAERINSTNAVKSQNYKVFDKTDGTQTSLLGAGSTYLLLPDEKTVRIALDTNKFFVGGHTYNVSVNYNAAAYDLEDLAGRKAPLGFYKEFEGTFASDTTAPEIVTSTYNKGSGELVLNFNEPVNNTLDYTKIQFNGTSLTGAVTVTARGGSDPTNRITATLAQADVTAVAALSGDLKINLLAGAVTDLANNKSAAGLTTPTLTVPPTIASAIYDGVSNRLTLTFNSPIQRSNVSSTDAAMIQKIHLYSAETGKVDLTSSEYKLTSTSNNQLVIELVSATANAFEKTGGNIIAAHTNPKVLVEAGAIENISDGTDNLKNYEMSGTTLTSGGSTLSVVADTTTPQLQSAVYTESTDKLVLTFNKAVSNSPTKANIKIKSSNSTLVERTMTNATVGETAPLNTLTLSLTHSDFDNLITASRAGEKIYVYMDANAVTDTNSTANAALAYGTLELSYKDDVAPKLDTTYSSDGIDELDKQTVKVKFDEKVAKTSAENKANYTIYRTSNSEPLEVLSVTLDSSDEKTVTLVTKEQLNGLNYTLKINGVEDKTGNKITTAIVDDFTGSSTDVTKATLTKAQIVDSNANNQLDAADQLKLTFSKPVKFTTGYNNGTNIQNTFVLDDDGNAPFDGSGNNSTNNTLGTLTANSFTVNGNQVTIQLGSGAKLSNLGAVKIATKAGSDYTHIYLEDETGTKVDKASAAVIETPVGAPGIKSVVYKDVDGSGDLNAGDTLTGTFTSNMYVVSGQEFTIGDVSVATTTAKSLGTGASLQFTPGTDKFVVTVGQSPNIAVKDLGPTMSTHLNLGIADAQLEDSWGLDLTDNDLAVSSGNNDDDGNDGANQFNKMVTGEDTVGPKVTKVEWVDGEGYYLVTFDQPIYIDGFSGTEKILEKDNVQFTNASTAIQKVAPNQLKVTTVETVTPGLTKVDINGGLTFNGTTTVAADGNNDYLTDAYKNTVQSNGDGVVVSYSSDTTSPTMTKAEFISPTQMIVTFSEAVQIPNVGAASNLKFTSAGSRWIDDDNDDGDLADTSDHKLYPTTSVGFSDKILVTVDNTSNNNAGVPASIQANGLTADLKVATGTVKDASGNPVVLNATGIDIQGDKTAPLAPNATNLGYLGVNFETGNVVVSGSAVTSSEPGTLQVYIGSTTPTATTTPTAYYALDTSNQLAVGNYSFTKTGLNTGMKVYYRFVDRVGNVSDWVQDGIIPVAPTAAAIKASAGNTANYISNTTKGGATVSVTSASSALTTDLLFAVVDDGASHSVTNNGGTGVSVASAGVQTKDITLADAAGASFVDGNALTVRGYMKSAEGNISSYFTGTSGKYDVTVPTSTITTATYTASSDTLVITGTNFTTLAPTTTDVKDVLDWTKLVWDINTDNTTTANVTFTASDITSATVTSATNLTIVLAPAKGISLEAAGGYSGGNDAIDVTAGFTKDLAGNPSAADAVSDGAITVN